MLGISYWVFPVESAKCVDTYHAQKTIYGTEPKYAVWKAPDLLSKSKNLVLLGASNVREGFRPEIVAEKLPEYSIHNLAVGASNISQIRQIVDMILKSDDKGTELPTFVLGIWYGLFVENHSRWIQGRTDIDIEVSRFGLYQDELSGRQEPMYSTKTMRLIRTLLRPVFFVSYIYNFNISVPTKKLKYMVASALKGNIQVKPSVATDLNSIVVDERMRQYALSFWERYMGSDGALSVEQFNELIELTCEIKKKNGGIVLVDLPLPAWHQERSPHYDTYQKLKVSFLSELSNSKIYTLNMQELNNNLDYYDSAHPKPDVRKIWSRKLGELLSGVLEKEYRNDHNDDK